MSNIRIEKVNSLPVELTPNTVYFVKNEESTVVYVYVSNVTGSAVHQLASIGGGVSLTEEQVIVLIENALANLAGNALPAMNDTAAAGVAGEYSRSDHVHPSDESRTTHQFVQDRIDEIYAHIATVQQGLTDVDTNTWTYVQDTRDGLRIEISQASDSATQQVASLNDTVTANNTAVHNRIDGLTFTNSSCPITNVLNTDKTLLPEDAGTLLRFSANGTKTLTVSSAGGHSADSLYHISNRSESGNLTLINVGGMTINPPKGGSLILEPSDTVSLHVVSPTEMDCYGSTAAGADAGPAGAWHQVMGPDFWYAGDLTWNGTSYAKTRTTVGASIVASTDMTASQLRITYTVDGLASFGVVAVSGESIMFPQRDTGTWTDTMAVMSGTIGAGSMMTPNSNDTGVRSIVISNIEIYY